MLARLLAVVAAVAMVVAAIVIRGRMDERKEERSTPVRFVCAQEFASVCDRIASAGGGGVRLTIEPAATTAERLTRHVTGDPGLDGWLAPRTWVSVVNETRQAAGNAPVLDDVGTAVARTPLVMVVNRERGAVLAKRCPEGQLTWKCVGDAAAARTWPALGGEAAWGLFKLGFDDPSRSATGLSVFGSATASYFGRIDLSSGDLEDDGWLAWAQRVADSMPAAGTGVTTPLTEMLVKFPAAFDVVGTTEADAGPTIANYARRSEISVAYPPPVATLDAVFAATTGSRVAGRARGVATGDGAKDAFAEAGWRVDGRPRAAGVPAQPSLPTGDGLPPPGFLAALRTEWEELRS